MARKARLSRDRYIHLKHIAAGEGVSTKEILRRAIERGLDIHVPISLDGSSAHYLSWDVPFLRCHALGVDELPSNHNHQDDESIILVDEDVRELLRNEAVFPREAYLTGLTQTVSPFELPPPRAQPLSPHRKVARKKSTMNRGIAPPPPPLPWELARFGPPRGSLLKRSVAEVHLDDVAVLATDEPRLRATEVRTDAIERAHNEGVSLRPRQESWETQLANAKLAGVLAVALAGRSGKNGPGPIAAEAARIVADEHKITGAAKCLEQCIRSFKAAREKESVVDLPAELLEALVEAVGVRLGKKNSKGKLNTSKLAEAIVAKVDDVLDEAVFSARTIDDRLRKILGTKKPRAERIP